jgi:hypothetical protein
VYLLGCVKNANAMFVDEAWAIKKLMKNIHCHKINELCGLQKLSVVLIHFVLSTPLNLGWCHKMM